MQMQNEKDDKFESVGKSIICDPEKCAGCDQCMYICSFRYSSKFGAMKSMIQVIRLHPFLNFAVACQHCKDPDCVDICPTEALSQSEETGIIHVDQDKCTGCGWCIQACPYGAMNFDMNTKLAFICDLCEEEEPMCIAWCPSEALELGTLKNFREKITKYMNKEDLFHYPEIKKWLKSQMG